jgi:hypothetical protein
MLSKQIKNMTKIKACGAFLSCLSILNSCTFVDHNKSMPDKILIKTDLANGSEYSYKTKNSISVSQTISGKEIDKQE